MDPILKAMGASENTLDFSKDYTLWVVVVGGIPASLSMALSQLLRSEGHGGKAGFGLSMGGVLNIILDPIFMFFVFPKGMEVTGAAVATMISNIVSLIYYLAVYYKIRKETVLSVSIRQLPMGLRFTGKTLSVGFPSAISSILVCVSIMINNKLVAGYGDIAVAAVGIVKKLEMLPNNVGTGLCQGMIPLISYNYASRNYKRMRKTINFSRIAGLAFAAICIIAFEIFAGNIAWMFIREAQTTELTTSFLRIMCLATPLTICNFHMTYTMQAMGKGKESLFLAACRQGIFHIPLLFVMNSVVGLYGIIWTQFISDALTVIVSYIICRRTFKRLGKRLEN